MVKNFKIRLVKLKSLIILFGIITLFLLPLVIYPENLVGKDNDLGRNYYPLFSFLRESILLHHQIPLWRSDQMMGELIIGNPLLPVFYPANILFLLFPVSGAFFTYYLVHLFLAGLATFYFARLKKMPEISCFAAALFYALSIKLLAHMAAGHVTMVAAFAYLPLVLISFEKLVGRFDLKWLAVGSVSLLFMYFNYPTVFYYTWLFLGLYYLYHNFDRKPARLFKNLVGRGKVLILLFSLWLGLSAVVFIPQLEFANFSNRSSLNIEDIALPLWNINKFIFSLSFPYLIFSDLDHESLLYLGAVPSLLAAVAFFNLPRFKKIFLSICGFGVILFVLNLSTPFFPYFYNYLPLLKYSRVTTRLWFVIAFVVAILAAMAIGKIKNRKIIAILIALFVVESMFIFYLKTSDTPTLSKEEALYKYLEGDTDIFRVYCATYCFNPQLAQKYNLEILNGESPIADKKFLQFLELAGNYSYGRFAVIFPPYQVWQQSQKPMPNTEILGIANVKYVVSTYEMTNQNLLKVSEFGRYQVYLNKQNRRRAYFEDSNEQVDITFASPNLIVLRFPAKNYSRRMVYAENYYPGWQVVNGNVKNEVGQNNFNMRTFEVLPRTQEAILKFSPRSYALGKTITFGTIVLLIICYIRYGRKR